MKNLSLLFVLCVLGYSTMFGQDIKLIYQGSTIMNDSFVYVVGTPTTPDISDNLWVENNTQDTLSVTVITYELDVVNGTLNATCWDFCPPADTSGQNPIRTSPALTINPGGIDYSFAPHLYPDGVSGCSHFRYVFEGTNGVTTYRDSVDFYFNHGEACAAVAVDLVENPKDIFEVYPNPAQEFINIELNTEVEATALILTNVLGQVVKTTPINGITNNIQLSTDAIEAGTYFLTVRLKNNQQAVQTIQVLK